MKYYEVTARGTRVNEQGKQEVKAHKMLIEGMTFSDAERSGYNNLIDGGIIDVEISAITITKNKDDRFLQHLYSNFYGVKVEVKEMADNGKEKTTSYYHIVSAQTMDEAKESVISDYNNLMLDYLITEVKQLQYMDYCPSK